MGPSITWLKYGVGKNATDPACAQYTTRGMWYAIASAEFGGAKAAVKPTHAAIAAMAAAISHSTKPDTEPPPPGSGRPQTRQTASASIASQNAPSVHRLSK